MIIIRNKNIVKNTLERKIPIILTYVILYANSQLLKGTRERMPVILMFSIYVAGFLDDFDIFATCSDFCNMNFLQLLFAFKSV